MDTKEFRTLFDNVAQSHGFELAFGRWVKESPECIVTLDLQKSNFSRIYYLNISVFIQGVLEKHYIKSKELYRNLGDAFRRQPKEYDNVLDLDAQMEEIERRQTLNALFKDFLVPFSTKALTRSGLKELVEHGELSSFTMGKGVKEELNLASK